MPSEKKQITNHQLGVALVSFMENFEKSQKQILFEQKRIQEDLKDLEWRINNLISNSEISVDCKELIKYNEIISKTSIEASDRLMKAMKGYYFNKYLLLFFALILVCSCFIYWLGFSFLKYK